MPFCSRCGAQVGMAGETFCSICGTPLMTAGSPAMTLQPVYVPPLYAPDTRGAYYVPQMIVPMHMKNTTVATVLSLFIVGVGQIYAGRAARGFGIIALVSLLCVAAYLIFSLQGLLLVAPFIVGIYVWQIYDAYTITKKYNEHTKVYARPPW
jgi:TM2 domain-containing membrane protein YozV